MRTIKFRGKSIDGGNWIYGSLLSWPDGKTMVYDTLMSDGSMGGHDVFPDTVCQFTGLKDKNNKDIYDGDIIKVGDENEMIEVRFVRGVFAFLWNGSLDDEFPTCSPTHEWADVVGNIYDNPDLLTIEKL